MIEKEESETNKLIYSLLLYHIDVDKAIEMTEKFYKKNKIYLFDKITCLYLNLFCNTQEIKASQCNDIIVLIDKIFKKHSQKDKDIPYIKDNNISNMKKDILINKIKKSNE
jgi:hypothetical protein